MPVDVVADPADLSGIGRAVSGRLERWHHVDGRLRLHVAPLASLLSAAEPAVAYRFLALLTRQVAHAGGTGHYHLDPAAVDEELRLTVEPLFDAVAEVDGTGWTVRSP